MRDIKEILVNNSLIPREDAKPNPPAIQIGNKNGIRKTGQLYHVVILRLVLSKCISSKKSRVFIH